MKKLVIKIGGSTLGSLDTTYSDLVELQKRGFGLVVVHGGGKTITEWQEKLGAGTKFVNGRRVTDRATLNVVVAVLAGLVNKEIVAALNKIGGKAIGLSGVDGGMLTASIMDKLSGYTGKVTGINSDMLIDFLDGGFITVIAPPCLYAGKKEGDPGFLNVNADTVAGTLARAIKAERLVFLTDVPGIYDENKNILNELNSGKAKMLMKKGVISEGMIPKIEACLESVKTIKLCKIVDGRSPHALLQDIEGYLSGTTIINS